MNYRIKIKFKQLSGLFRYMLHTKSYNCNRFEYDIVIVAIIKNEGKYIEEWVKYHKCIGIDKIYLYDNGSTDSTQDVLAPYISSGYIKLIDFPGVGRQLDAYNNALKQFGDKCKYMAFIDADEFILLEDHNLNLIKVLDEIVGMNKHSGGVAVNWRMFGSSGYISKPPHGGVLDNFLYRAKDNGKGNGCIKSIVMPKFVVKYQHAHYPTYIFGKFNVDENGKIVKGWRNEIGKTKIIRINHYFTKSKQEWIERRSLGKADSKNPEKSKRTLQEFYDYDNNDIYDDSMLYYVDLMNR